MKLSRVLLLALLLIGCEMYYDCEDVAKPTREEQCIRLHSIQWCMGNDACHVTADQVEEARLLHSAKVCNEKRS